MKAVIIDFVKSLFSYFYKNKSNSNSEQRKGKKLKISISKCKKCGAALYKNASVCSSCGNKKSSYPAFSITWGSIIIGFLLYSFEYMELGVVFFTILPLIAFLFTKSNLDRILVLLVYVGFFATVIYIDKTYWDYSDMIMGNTEDIFSLVKLYVTGGFIK